MSVGRVEAILATCEGASAKGIEDGTRVYVHYRSVRKPSRQALKERRRAVSLRLPLDRYTGRVSSVKRGRNGDMLVLLWVELERDHKYRTLNVTRGKVYQFVPLRDYDSSWVATTERAANG